MPKGKGYGKNRFGKQVSAAAKGGAAKAGGKRFGKRVSGRAKKK